MPGFDSKELEALGNRPLQRKIHRPSLGKTRVKLGVGCNVGAIGSTAAHCSALTTTLPSVTGP